MTIDNRLTTGKLRMGFLLLLFLSPLLLIYSLTFGAYQDAFLTLPISILMILAYFFMHQLKLYFIYFSDEGTKLTFRYYYVHPFMHRYKAIEIPKSGFSSYELGKAFLGLQTTLVLIQKARGKEVRYHVLYLTAVNKKAVVEIEKSLKKHLAKSRQKTAQQQKKKFKH